MPEIAGNARKKERAGRCANTIPDPNHTRRTKGVQGMTAEKHIGDSTPKFKTYSEQRDVLEERAAIMAEANGWSQGRAERQIAYERGFATWHQMLRAAK